MKEKRVTIRIPAELYQAMYGDTQKTKDIVGYKPISLNAWILLSIKEKISRKEK
jgi:hypothetical protein